MQVNEVKHRAKMVEWKQRIMECRSSGMGVVEWCKATGHNRTTYYRWEREIFGQVETGSGLKPAEPEFAELAIADHSSGEKIGMVETSTVFHPSAVIRVGEMEVELSNSVSIKLMGQIKELLRNAE